MLSALYLAGKVEEELIELETLTKTGGVTEEEVRKINAACQLPRAHERMLAFCADAGVGPTLC
jgi:hypothetical protein